MMDAVADKESAYTLSFLIAFGSLAELIEMVGGISGFSEKVGKWAKNEKGILGWAWLLSIITFFDSSFHTIAVGVTLFGLGFGKFKIGKSSEEKEEFTKGHIKKEELLGKSIDEYPKDSKNLITPVAVLLISTIFFFGVLERISVQDSLVL